MMMREFIEKLEKQGASFHLNGDKVKVSAPPEIMTSTIKQALAQYKPDLLAYLKALPLTDWREQYEERAAIRQYNGNLPYEEASYLAKRETLHDYIGTTHPAIMAAFDAEIHKPLRH